MSYHMRRKDRQLAAGDAAAVLRRGKYVVLALCRENEPYAVTLSYGFDQECNCLYLHCAKEGLKLQFLAANPAVCGTVIIDSGYADGECSHPFETVVLRGTVSRVEAPEEKKHAVATIVRHLESDPEAIRRKVLKTEAVYDAVTVLRLDITELSGKKGK